MAEGVFVLQELKSSGNGTFDPDPDGETFVWTADADPQSGANGGARAAPLSPWAIPLRQRTVRTDYPGARLPSEQVIGPAYQPFTLRGRWDDRYNFAGYAVREMRRFEAMVGRGRMVRLQFQAQVFEGVITDFVPEYRRDWDIGYEFTFSNHGRPGDTSFDRSPSTDQASSAPQAFDDAVLVTAQMETTQREAPAAALTSVDAAPSVAGNVSKKLDSLSVRLRELGDSLDTRKGALKPITDFKRLATQFRMLHADALDVTLQLVAARSDLSLGVRTAMSVLDFETWMRTQRYHARLVMLTSQKAARDMEERADPEPLRFYRPRKGESLYAISRRFYGTPHAANFIAERNALASWMLTGDELLIIPERGEG